ncbi:MAG TPA: hypothetical protein VHO23_00755 [Candidatus Paceibacterota bacterium]|nr:hypothetical protein [Candidatus Paceibacterota bacterium]
MLRACTIVPLVYALTALVACHTPEEEKEIAESDVAEAAAQIQGSRTESMGSADDQSFIVIPMEGQRITIGQNSLVQRIEFSSSESEPLTTKRRLAIGVIDASEPPGLILSQSRVGVASEPIVKIHTVSGKELLLYTMDGETIECLDRKTGSTCAIGK